MLAERLKQGAATKLGREFGVDATMSYAEFARRVPLFDYERFKPYVERMVGGEQDVTVGGRVKMFARSSGTTSDRSKYIPVTRESVLWNHTRGMRDVAALYTAAYPESRVFNGKTLTLGGSCVSENGVVTGDLSALLIADNPKWSGWFRAPRMQTALLADFGQKTERIARECASENITAFAGVPSWNLALMRRVVELNGRKTLREVWPDLELFVYGGVELTPYRMSFDELVGGERDMRYMQTYNASEGFFAVADNLERDDMLLMLDYGTFYEFRQGATVVPLDGVRCGETYAMLITSNNGLWRYEIGDTVEFTSVAPYRVRFAGRTSQYINVFGEEVVVANTDKALFEACRRSDVVVSDYTVAPCYMSLDRQGAHEWAIEFKREPVDLERFARTLDDCLRELNSDYDAKRSSTLDVLRVRKMPNGRFIEWMQRMHKNKVARLSNDRRIIEQLLGK